MSRDTGVYKQDFPACNAIKTWQRAHGSLTVCLQSNRISVLSGYSSVEVTHYRSIHKTVLFWQNAVSDDAAPTSGASDFLCVFLQPRCQDGLFGDNDGVQNEDWVMEPWLDGAVYISVLNDRCLSPVYHLMEKVTEKPTDVKCTAKKSCLDPEVRPVYQWMSLQAQL